MFFSGFWKNRLMFFFIGHPGFDFCFKEIFFLLSVHKNVCPHCKYSILGIFDKNKKHALLRRKNKDNFVSNTIIRLIGVKSSIK